MTKLNIKVPEIKPVPYTGLAVCMRREPDGILAVAIEFNIVDGVVVSERFLNAPDLPASAAGQGSKALWRMFQG